jgi:asparagine synthase (glutamine-hydrolysing)
MCGFAGYLTTRPSSEDGHRAAVDRMIAPIAHRGPDDQGIWADAAGGVALGFRRLAIIDLSERGHQPMRSASGRFMMVFNGEVYNFAELRQELEAAGARFLGHSDSEVMLAAFEHWGVERSLPRFVGMFAFALWDSQERCVHLARDRFGKKPLVVYAEPGLVSFGSELKSLVVGPAFDRSIDPDALTAYLRFLYVPAPHTIYRRAVKLRPGHLLTVRDAGAPLPPSRPYWTLEEVVRAGRADPFTGDDAAAVAEGERLLGDATRLRMIADVPLGAFLSGGIDSSLVVALMQESAERPVRTFSVGFEEADYDETAHAARVAKHLGTSHSEFRLTADDALRLVPDLPEWFDEPLADPSQLPTFLVCRESRREVTVAISGDGGDEIFGGYNRYVQGEQLIRRGSSIGALGRRLAAGGIDVLSPKGWDRVFAAAGPLVSAAQRYRGPGEKLHKLGTALRYDTPTQMYRSLLSAAFQEPSQLVREGQDVPGGLERAFALEGELGAIERMMLADQLEYLPDDLLAKVDRTSMAVSLEVRVPLLDHRVAAFAWRLPRRFKVRDGETKWLLRQMLYKRVPRAMVERPKMGFSVPIDRWLRGALRGWVEDLLSPASLAASGALHVPAVREAWATFLRGDGRVSGMGIWALANFQAWHRRWATG